MFPIEFVFNNGEAELGEAFGYTQQSISRYLKKGAQLQEMISAGSYKESDIWGYSPTEERRKAYVG